MAGNSEGNRKCLSKLLAISLLVIFSVIDFVVKTGVIQSVDVETFKAVNTLALGSSFDFVMVILTTFGRELVWGALTFGLFFIGHSREKKAALMLVILFIFLIGLSIGLKELNARPRPYDTLEGVRLLVEKESDFSFPSAHALFVAGGIVIIWSFLKSWWAPLLTAEGALVAFSRVYVGVHYPMDVIGGVFLGAGCALLLCTFPGIAEWSYRLLPKWLKS